MKLGKINELSIANFAYAHPLQHIYQPPQTLFVAGKLPKTRRPTVAIVGSRKPTTYGIAVTHRLAYDLAKQGVIIVSGLAYGIDAIAHKAALEAGGTTIAVLAGGLHAIYPKNHLGLAQHIIKSGGAIISEQPPGTDAHKFHFLARNRIISGIADAIIVTEATERSGTSSTFAHALEQNKQVFAVPGPITSLLSAGPNRMLQTGAAVVLSARDILDQIAPQLRTQQTKLLLADTPAEQTILELIQQGITDGDELHRKSKLSASVYLQSITLLELNGTIRNVGANHWQCR